MKSGDLIEFHNSDERLSHSFHLFAMTVIWVLVYVYYILV